MVINESKVILPRVLEITEDNVFRYARVQTEDGFIVWRRRAIHGMYPPCEMEDKFYNSMKDFIAGKINEF